MNTDKKTFRFGNHTDIGNIRRQNEDYLGYFDTLNGHLFIVCDGMGGHMGGAVASQTAVSSVRDYMQQQFYPEPLEALQKALQYANYRVYAEAQNNPDLRGMGTTCVTVLVKNKLVYYAYVGDSRLYLQRQDQLQRLSKDHSFVQALIDQGLINEEEAFNHPRRNELLRALGTGVQVEVSVCEEPLVMYQNDLLLLCSDGLTGLVKDEQIQQILQEDMEPQYKAMKLVQTANALGGDDNTTVQLIEFVHADEIFDYQKKKDDFESSVYPTNTIRTYSQSFASPEHASKGNTRSGGSMSIGLKKNSGYNKNRSVVDKIMGGITLPKTGNSFLPLLILSLAAIFTAYLYFNPDNALSSALKGKRNEVFSRQNLRKTADPAAKKAYDNLTKKYPLFKNIVTTYKDAKDNYEQLKEGYEQIKELKDKGKQTFDSLLVHKRKGRESLNRLARRYGISPEDILKANGVSNEEDLKKLDSLLIPVESADK